MNALIQVKVGKEEKDQAGRILKSLGLDIQTAIKIYIKAIINNRGLPFEIKENLKFGKEKEFELAKALEEIDTGIGLTEPMTLNKAQKYLYDN
jgi:DNA-damage-inducible protein J